MEIEGSVMFKLVVERREYLVLLLIYKIFKQVFLHDSKRADIYPISFHSGSLLITLCVQHHRC